MFKYDINNRQFKSQKVVFENKMYLSNTHGSVYIDDVIYFNQRYNKDIESYKISTNEWEIPITPNIPLSVSGACLTTDSDFLYVLGGRLNSNATKYFQVYHLEDAIWINDTPNLYTAAQYAACSIINGQIYLFGGFASSNSLDIIQTLYVGLGEQVLISLQTEIWIQLDVKMSIARCQLSAVVCASNTELIYLIAGGNGLPTDYASDLIEIFNTSDNSLRISSTSLNQPRQGQLAVCVDDYLYVFGGLSNSTTLNNWERSNILSTS